MLYKVVIHYEGGWLFEIEADSKDEAKEIAEEQFAGLDDRELVANLSDIYIDDCWEA